MADTTVKNNQTKNVNNDNKTTDKESGTQKSRSLGIRLTPTDGSDRPVVVNYSTINAASGIAFIDFGFFEPGILSALQRVGKQGGKLPERLDGKLAVRVAMGYDSMATLHQQLGKALAELSSQKPEKATDTKKE